MNAEGINVWNAEIIALQLFDDASEAEAVRLRTMTIDELREDMDLPALDDERGNIIPGLISQPMRDDLGKVPMDTPLASVAHDESNETYNDDGVL